MTLQNRLSFAVSKLRDAGVDSAAKDARLIVAHTHQIAPDRLTLHLHDDDGWGRAQENYFLDCVAARETHRPIAKIIGYKAFWGRNFQVNDDVLDPRPETETLIATALNASFSKVLDLGTGSGAIIVSLLAEQTAAHGVAIDISDGALCIAQENAEKFKVADRVSFLKSDMFCGIGGGEFDLIVSNPPYLAIDEMDDVPADTLFDPRIALTDEADGLTFYRQIAVSADRYLAPQGRILVEIGPSQGHAVVQMFVDAGFGHVEIIPDLDQRDRVVVAKHVK